MVTTKKRIVTILNAKGLNYMNAYEYYDDYTKINTIEAKIYNAFGKEIKKIKRKNFKDNSVTQGAIATDHRVLYLDYTPTQYPFTLVLESEKTSSNTAFIPYWLPIEGYNTSIIHSEVKINYTNDVDFKHKLYNSDGSIVFSEGEGFISYKFNNLKAIESEQLSPKKTNFMPHVLFGLNKFELAGVTGYANDWSSFGKWMYDSLLSDTEEISQETITKIGGLIGEEKDIEEITRIIYNYVQNKTRYVSVQLGIGGWKPMPAKDVDRLGYGDCKALTNYTRSILKHFNIPSYYTVVYAGDLKRNLYNDFVSLQGNHAILAVPVRDDLIWLECTSQSQPFGFQGSFTDDRTVLAISENKAEIVTTKVYNESSNKQKTQSNIILSTDGSFKAKLQVTSEGMELDEKLFLSHYSTEDKTKYYKKRFSDIGNMNIVKQSFDLNKRRVVLNEALDIEALDFFNTDSDRVFIVLNPVNQVSFIPQNYKNRLTPFQVERGYFHEDNLVIDLPEGYNFEAISDSFELETDFGHYKSEITLQEDKVLVNRIFKLKKGYYSKDRYNDYVDFRTQIAKNERAKMVLSKK